MSCSKQQLLGSTQKSTEVSTLAPGSAGDGWQLRGRQSAFAGDNSGGQDTRVFNAVGFRQKKQL